MCPIQSNSFDIFLLQSCHPTNIEFYNIFWNQSIKMQKKPWNKTRNIPKVLFECLAFDSFHNWDLSNHRLFRHKINNFSFWILFECNCLCIYFDFENVKIIPNVILGSVWRERNSNIRPVNSCIIVFFLCWNLCMDKPMRKLWSALGICMSFRNRFNLVKKLSRKWLRWWTKRHAFSVESRSISMSF